MSMPALASTPRMVGRRAELDTLLEAFDEGRDGRPRTVVVRGEAGIGKTRLVQEFLAEASVRRDGSVPLVVALGQCVDLGPIGAPFGPVRRVLRDLHAAVGTESLRAAAGSPAVIASLASLVPGIADDTAGDDLAAGFAEAIEVLLEQLSRDRHVVVVIEDLQWADASTLVLLKTLASTLRGRHLTIVATYRSDDIDRFHPLRPVLAELDRTRTIVRVEVGPLSGEEVAEQVAQLAADDPRDVDELFERSGGIPFLVEELVDIGDRALPDTLRELVLARYARLSDDAQETVRAMAAGGVHCDHDVLVSVSSLDEHRLDLALREAIDGRVVRADGAGYAFRHALTREAVHAEMLPSERVRVHRRYAEELNDRRAESPEAISSIAEHWLAARDLTAAFDATVIALAHSRVGYSPATSAKLAERLTELWDQIPDAATRAGTTLPELHLDAANAWHDVGESERALRSANEGLAVCPDDPLTRAGLLRKRFVEVFNTVHENRREDLLTAIGLLEGLSDRRAHALHSRILSNLAITEHGSEAREHAARAIALAEESADDDALAVALTIEAWRIANDEDDAVRGMEPVERAAQLPLSPAPRAYVASEQIELLLRCGRFDEAVVVGERHYGEVVRAGIERGAGSSIAFSLAQAHFAVGRPEEGLRYARRAQRLDRGLRAPVVRLVATHHSWNDRAEARDALLSAERTVVDEWLRSHPEKREAWRIDRGDAAMTMPGAGAPRSAERDALVDELLEASAIPSALPISRHSALTAAMLLAGTRAGGRDRHRLDRLSQIVGERPLRGVARVHAAFIDALLATADASPVAERLARWIALDAWLDDEPVLPIWHRLVVRTCLAAALVEAGRRTEGAELLAAVQAEAAEKGVARVGRWATDLAAHAGLTDASYPDGESDGALSSLTARERQVLALVAEGLTNPQIGERLFISPKTASVHVSAILTKIGAANRAEAAAVYVASLDA